MLHQFAPRAIAEASSKLAARSGDHDVSTIEAFILADEVVGEAHETVVTKQRQKRDDGRRPRSLAPPRVELRGEVLGSDQLSHVRELERPRWSEECIALEVT